MALVSRLSRLFQADFHAVLDRIEEPDLQLRQAVREMQFALDQDKQRLQLLQHESAQLESAAEACNSSLEEFDRELDICLAAKKDDLARDLIRRKLATEKQMQQIESQANGLEGQQQSLRQQIDEQQQQLAAMKQKLELLVGNERDFGAGSLHAADSVRSEEIEIALLREKERRAKS